MSDECDKHKGYSFECSPEHPLPEEPLTIAGIEGYETYVINDNTIGTRPKWISIEDRLPQIDETVLSTNGELIAVTTLELSIRNGYRWQLLSSGCGCCDGDMDGVTHWMPLPKPPEEK